ncbi:MAG: hypothetical protein WC332_00705 [Clostridia bacterium]
MCMQIWSETDDLPVAKVESGKWGDEYPSIRFTKESTSLKPEIEAYMDMIDYGFIEQETAEANARFIVKACNCHNEMLEALKEIIKSINIANPLSPGYWELQKAKEVIAKAEGK